MDYDELLKRGKSGIPEQMEEKKRFEIPAVKKHTEGKKTIITNFNDICSTINRDPDAVAKYLLRDIGTAGVRADGRLILNGSFTNDELNGTIKKYVDNYVICKVCNLPDTNIIKVDRIDMIKCDACGASYQIKM
ncbi:translation initiation factor IF-2 subunit beta [Methanocella sp. CWC-04]|uniref:Translation initiation factor 2 subunit beta n=1 Tax=Methanooceanicella nereidis TaxID=2052831 RepID=A0AAP2W4U1_9EURY|nr:translation initiation factor IF-2 subunit beta [Methanocella sp. CWC-04]MCD1293683.1 translation initiation factor IF-2 subunit beta [Methanocella sp. CWC-04]